MHNNNNMKTKGPLKLLFGLMLLGLAAEWISLAASRGTYLRQMVYALERFPDFFNHIRRFYLNLPTVYMADKDACFPPLAYCFYYLLSRVLYEDREAEDYVTLAESPSGMLLIAVVTAVFAVLFVFAFQRRCRLREGWQKNLMAFLLLLSYPFWIAVERGNMTLGVLLLVMTAASLMDSEKPVLRELALLLFAAASAIKLYPAIFVFYYLSQKRWKEAFRYILYTALLFFVPFAFFGGVEGFRYFFHNITTVGSGATGVTIVGIIGNIGEKLGLSLRTGHQIGKAVAAVYAVVVLVFAFRNTGKCPWQTEALLTSMMIVFVPECGSYCLLYISVPFVLFINDLLQRSQYGIRDYLYAVLFALIFYAYPLPGAGASTALYLSLYVLLFCIIVDQFRMGFRSRKIVAAGRS